MRRNLRQSLSLGVNGTTTKSHISQNGEGCRLLAWCFKVSNSECRSYKPRLHAWKRSNSSRMPRQNNNTQDEGKWELIQTQKGKKGTINKLPPSQSPCFEEKSGSGDCMGMRLVYTYWYELNNETIITWEHSIHCKGESEGWVYYKESKNLSDWTGELSLTELKPLQYTCSAYVEHYKVTRTR